MNQITELTAAETEEVGGGVSIFLVNLVLAESGFYGWLNSKIASWFE
jgi:hypothetical protein